MRTIASTTYTNVSLTVLILLVLALLIKPYVAIPTAHAQDDDMESRRSGEQARKVAMLNPNADNADAIREVADAAKDIAAAIRESAKSQGEIAKALNHLGNTTK